MDHDESKRPMKEFKAGTISAAVWQKTGTIDGRAVPQHSIRIQKRYKDERSGEWKTTTYFRVEDMPRLALVANKVFQHVTLREIDNASVAGSQGG